VAVLWTVQNGYMDKVPLDRIKDYQTRLTEYLTTSKSTVLERIGREKALTDGVTAELKGAVEQFAQMWS
jgi:F-type H+-transporting ATPase subunit alpha